ncbi:MAG: TIGR02302 family protein [Pseudomonadota bacterium]
MANLSAPAPQLLKRVARTIARANVYGYAERIWPRLIAISAVVGVFLILSWVGLWSALPDSLRFILVGIIALVAMGTVLWALWTPHARRNESIRRVETASGLTGRPIAALDDQPFDTTDPRGAALWELHQAQMAAKVETLAAGLPKPRTRDYDRWGLRVGLALAVVAAFFWAGPERMERIEQAFAPPTPAPTVPIRVDVWATPPSYTGLPPRTLVTGADLRTRPGDETNTTLTTLPTGSRLTVLVSDPTDVEIALEPMDGTEAQALVADPQSPTSFEIDLTRDAALTLLGRRAELTIPILVSPDAPPSVRFAGEPGASAVGALNLAYHVEDDYAVTGVHAEVTPADERFADAEPLIDAPTIDLVLPPNPSGGTVETTRDFSAHPWAGLAVDMTLVARDGADQEGTSETMMTVLPARPFREDLARALVEQRRTLAVDERMQTRVLMALEALAIAPQDYMSDEYATFLALTVTTQRLRFAATRQDKLEVIDMLWQLALQVEDGDLSLAAERLREAEENLSNLLEQGASDEEIAQAMDELRQAFQEYMQELAQRLQNGQQPEDFANMPMQSIDPSSLQELMDQIQNLSELGAADAARQLMEELRNQLDQLRGAQAMQQREPSPQEQALREAIQDLQAITREQQRLLDETFPLSSDAQRQQLPRNPFRLPPELDLPNPGSRDGETENGPDQPGDRADSDNPVDQRLGELSEEQGTLQEQLQALMDQLRDLGLDPEQFGEADTAMGDATNLLGRGSAQGALSEQGRALEALRQGAQSMMEQLAGDGEGQGGQGQAQGPGQSPGPGQGMPRMMFGPGNDGPRGTDPLGRPHRAQDPNPQGFAEGDTVRVPEESDIQRARDILEEIQRRLGERARPPSELQYLDRLIERF